MKRTIKKMRPASASSGRGMDNTRTPARYGVYENDTLILTISAQASRPFASPEWDVCEGDKRIKTFSTFRTAKAWALTKYSMPLIQIIGGILP